MADFSQLLRVLPPAICDFFYFVFEDGLCLFVCSFVRSGTGTSLYGILIPALEKNDGI